MTNAVLLKEMKVSTLKGIGTKNEKLFEKVGVTSLNQLLHFYPRAYDAYEQALTLDALKSGEKASVLVTITQAPVLRTGGKTTVTVLTVKQDFQILEVVWYHIPYLRKVLKKGAVFVLRGMVTRRSGRWHMEHPELFTSAAYEALEGTVQPIYSLTAGLSNKTVQKSVKQVFEKIELFEYLPDEIQARCHLCTYEEALKNIHFPANSHALKSAGERLVFDEFLLYLLGLKKLKEAEQEENRFPIFKVELAKTIEDSLPYELTAAQKRVLLELISGLNNKTVMNRLIQGDVGSGKTILCFILMLIVSANGHQSALMAPTEVLAYQHYHSLCELLSILGMNEEPILLTGSASAKEKRLLQEDIRCGKAKMMVGTHALIQEQVEYNKLALVITDEQHRFGVKQRSLLGEKGQSPHQIVMSATPIPRTLALMLYGDMTISVLDEMPNNRLRVKNAVVTAEWRQKAYHFISKEIKAGHQAYIVCPMIEKNEALSCESVVEYTAKLNKEMEPSIRIAMLHGRMKEAQKNQIMADFSAGRIDLLVSTTVIEVGVDVANATVMMIENADRFGLAQLHQLRGRVGRGEAQSYCILVQSEGKDETNERLEILSRSNDGFYIAEEDLKLRGQGDLFGLRQSGEGGFVLADIYRDKEILKLASKVADEIWAEDPNSNGEKYRDLWAIMEEKTKITAI